jgi:hypothetical protein
MTNISVMPPLGGATTVVSGRSYTGATGAIVSAPDFDANVLCANGWLQVVDGGSGTTAQRPTAPVATKPNGLAGVRYLDTTLGYVVVHDGKNWRNPSTGAIV